MAKLTKKELAWIDEVQEVLNRCPSPEKIGFYTIGDPTVFLYDLRKLKDVENALDTGKASDWSPACRYVGAHFDETIDFPSPVESTAG
ncbi:hypothetical protein [Atlantibacter hermannii]|uniref:hypothetical protein n=1 Tax=Atlantibacter hermannii TaxID=565 RepID=UPI0028B1D151|nr:hypothetical protein [Atlantibacter hermannii]